ncbi:MAG: hypothetical protein HY706_10250 [Candidatus Hydrogenedentes bacterium]|nr:hypothetical protein [Candidatus Hydrogenedentota bacterium]
MRVEQWWDSDRSSSPSFSFRRRSARVCGVRGVPRQTACEVFLGAKLIPVRRTEISETPVSMALNHEVIRMSQ